MSQLVAAETEVELTIKAVIAGWRFFEIPISLVERPSYAAGQRDDDQERRVHRQRMRRDAVEPVMRVKFSSCDSARKDL